MWTFFSLSRYVSSAQRKFSRTGTYIKKRVLRSKSVRAILAKQIGRVAVAIFELHVLAVMSVVCNTALSGVATCLAMPRWALTCCGWVMDVAIPVMFALEIHEPLTMFVVSVMSSPLHSIARRIQYVKVGNVYNFYKIKYSILGPVFVYAFVVVLVLPITREFLCTCLVQSLMINLLTDFWPRRKEILQWCRNRYFDLCERNECFRLLNNRLGIRQHVEQSATYYYHDKLVIRPRMKDLTLVTPIPQDSLGQPREKQKKEIPRFKETSDSIGGIGAGPKNALVCGSVDKTDVPVIKEAYFQRLKTSRYEDKLVPTAGLFQQLPKIAITPQPQTKTEPRTPRTVHPFEDLPLIDRGC